MDKSFRGHLLECDVPESTADEIGKTYKKAHLFRSSLKTEALVDVYIKKLLGSAEGWEIDPVAGAVRTAWATLQPASAAVAASPLGAADTRPTERKVASAVTALERLETEKEYLAAHSDEVLDDDSRPGLLLLSAIKRQLLRSTGLSWLSWSFVKSLATEKRNASKTLKDIQAFEKLGCLEAASNNTGALVDMHSLSQMLQLRAVAYAMLGMGSLGAWKLYNKRFVALCTARTASNQRVPNFREAMEADDIALSAIFDEVNESCFLTNKIAEASDGLDACLKRLSKHGGDLDGLLRPRPFFEMPPAGAKRPWENDDGDREKKFRKKGACRFWKKHGNCRKGENCAFAHD